MFTTTKSYSSSPKTTQVPNPSQDNETITPRVLTILSYVLDKLVARNDKLVGYYDSNRLDSFLGVRAPNISMAKYLERIYKYTNCSPSCFVVGYVYIDRLAHRYPGSLAVSLNVHRLVVTSVMVASKVLDDVHYNNAVYAKIGGVSNAELNKLELELLFLLDFGVMVRSRVFESYCLHLENQMSFSGVDQRTMTSLVTNGVDDVTEISVEDSTSSSPPLQLVD